MIIDERYFTYPTTYIAGIETVDANGRPAGMAPKIINDIKAYIARLEPLFLKQLLGDKISKNACNYPKLMPLLVQPDHGTSVIAKYVYFFYSRDHASFNTVSGEKIKTTDSSRPASVSFRLAQTWNEMVDECWNIVKMADDIDIKPRYESEIFEKINVFNL